ncbi:MAG: methylamine dehydrogenase [Pseudomonadota bacterium]
MDWLLVSHVLLWIGFVVMALINLALARQVGVLYERVAPAGALMMNSQLRVGDAAPSLAVQNLAGELTEIGEARNQDEKRAQLLFFLAPDCPVCSELVPAVKSAASAEREWLDVILASDGEALDHRGYVAERELGAFPYVVSEVLGKTYGVSKLPYGVLIDETSRIAALGIVNSREHLESLFEAKERKVASIQDYMNSKQSLPVVEADNA